MLDTSLFTVIGVAAFLGAGYRVPLAAITFVAEATGRPGFVVPGLLAAVVADLMMGSRSVTAYQRPARRAHAATDGGVGGGGLISRVRAAPVQPVRGPGCPASKPWILLLHSCCTT